MSKRDKVGDVRAIAPDMPCGLSPAEIRRLSDFAGETLVVPVPEITLPRTLGVAGGRQFIRRSYNPDGTLR